MRVVRIVTVLDDKKAAEGRCFPSLVVKLLKCGSSYFYKMVMCRSSVIIASHQPGIYLDPFLTDHHLLFVGPLC